jgi:hypothetical protein
LIQAHERERKAEVGSDGTHRGRLSASIDAAGAALGSCGLMAFAVICWLGLSKCDATLTIAVATIVWLFVAVALWELRKRRWFARRSRTRSQFWRN